MREILFRGKTIDGEWVYGNLVTYISGAMQILIIGTNDLFVDVIPKTVGQYIGIRDINGKKIFVGDRVRCYAGEYYQGYWEHDYVVEIDDIRYIPEDLYYTDQLEVIGNINFSRIGEVK